MPNSERFKAKVRNAREESEMAPQDPDPIPGFDDFGHIKLQSVINCRDLGGLPTADGKRIKKRMLLRSGQLHDATAEDMHQLTRMHDLAYDIDLRADYEVSSDPDPLPLMQGIEYVNLPALSDGAIGFSGLKHFGSDLRNMTQFAKDPVSVVEGLYPKCIHGEYGIKAYSSFLDHLISEHEGATLWHCTQGKDRTGIAAILVEYILGVPGEYILQDYLATNLFIKPWIDKSISVMMNNPVLKRIGLDFEAYAYANLIYVNAMLDTVEQSYGGMNNYIERILGFGPEKQELMREMYLE